MNPFDNIHETKNRLNSNNNSVNRKTTSKSKATRHHTVKRPKKATKRTKDKTTQLQGHSTISLSNENIAYLKAFKKVDGDNSLNDLISKMIHCSKPLIVNTDAKHKSYDRAIKFIKMAIQFKNS